MIKFTITAETVRNLCIKHNWYTCGNGIDYTAMLNGATLCNTDADTMESHIENIMCNIRWNSDTERIMSESGMSYEEIGESMMFALLNACTLTIE